PDVIPLGVRRRRRRRTVGQRAAEVLRLEHLAEALGAPIGDEELEARTVSLASVAVIAEDAGDARPHVGNALRLHERAQALREVRIGREAAPDPQVEADGIVAANAHEGDVVDLVLRALLAAAGDRRLV